jgi:hypothetical protein
MLFVLCLFLFNYIPKNTDAIIYEKHSSSTQGLPDFSLVQHTKIGPIYQMTTKYTKEPLNLPNDRKIYQRALIYICVPAFSIPRPSKIYPDRDFCMQMYHLATLIYTLYNIKIYYIKNSQKEALRFPWPYIHPGLPDVYIFKPNIQKG